MTSTKPLRLDAAAAGHLMLLYEEEDTLNQEISQVLADALKTGRLCAYASVHASETDHIEKISRNIPDFHKHVREGDLVIINFRPFYDSMLQNDLTLFEKLKQDLEEKVYDRSRIGKNSNVLVVADCAGNLTKGKYFDQSIKLEKWWQATCAAWQIKGLNISLVCPHPSALLGHEERGRELSQLSNAHTLTLELPRASRPNTQQSRIQDTVSNLNVSVNHSPIRILIAEPEPDIQALYSRFLNYHGVDLVITESGTECLGKILGNGHGKPMSNQYDMIILDWHIRDMNPATLVRDIRQKIPNQRIVITAASDESEIKDNSMKANIDYEDVLIKPFSFSQLLAKIKPNKRS